MQTGGWEEGRGGRAPGDAGRGVGWPGRRRRTLAPASMSPAAPRARAARAAPPRVVAALALWRPRRAAPPQPHARAAARPELQPPPRDDGGVGRQAVAARAAPASGAAAFLAAASLTLAAWTVPPAALAEVTTVTPSEAIAAAKPLPKAPVDKGRIWLLFAVGAAAVFGVALAAERVEAAFPAIAKANRAVAESRARSVVAEAAGDGDRLAASVADGLAAARRKQKQKGEEEERGGEEGG